MTEQILFVKPRKVCTHTLAFIILVCDLITSDDPLFQSDSHVVFNCCILHFQVLSIREKDQDMIPVGKTASEVRRAF